MKKLLLIFVLTMFGMTSKAEQISSVETNGSWIYIYNSQGKKYKTMSVSTVGTVMGYSSSFFVSQNGSWIYLWDSEGKKLRPCPKAQSVKS